MEFLSDLDEPLGSCFFVVARCSELRSRFRIQEDDFRQAFFRGVERFAESLGESRRLFRWTRQGRDPVVTLPDLNPHT